MEVEIVGEKENPLLKRKELKIRIIHDDATPSRAEVREKVIALTNADKETVVVSSIKTKFGIKESIGLVNIYKTKERALEIEPKHKLEKNLLIERKKGK